MTSRAIFSVCLLAVLLFMAAIAVSSPGLKLSGFTFGMSEGIAIGPGLLASLLVGVYCSRKGGDFALTVSSGFVIAALMSLTLRLVSVALNPVYLQTSFTIQLAVLGVIAYGMRSQFAAPLAAFAAFGYLLGFFVALPQPGQCCMVMYSVGYALCALLTVLGGYTFGFLLGEGVWGAVERFIADLAKRSPGFGRLVTMLKDRGF